MATVESLRPRVASGDALVLDGVTRAFGALRAVDDVSLTVAAGERRAILGANGAGKTTLFNAITGDFPATAGRIRFFDEDVTDLPPYERIRRGLRRTYQSSLLFRDLSVRDNVFLAVRGVASGRFSFLRPRRTHASCVATQDLLERVRLTPVADDLVATLSHGQQRQLEIAMALATEPRLLLLDEPVAGMGLEESQRMVRFLSTLKGRITIVLVEHDMDAVFTLADRISVMVYGRIIATGTPPEIRGNDEVRRAYLGEDQA